MATNTASAMGSRAVLPLWVRVLLGIVFIIAGVIVLGDVVLATIISTILIGICAVVGGVFEIIHAFWTKGWGGFAWQIFLGLLYVVGGLVLVSQPVSGSLILTYVLGIVLFASGCVRLYVGIRYWAQSGWLIFLSGIFGILAGLAILIGWPMTGLWVIGFLLGIDLIFHGVGWLLLAWQPAARTA